MQSEETPPIKKSNHYVDSWEIYKAHSEGFKDDYRYYYNFCNGFNTLELFAGYGRLSNHLVGLGIDLETVELEPNFAKFINLPANRNHVDNVLSYRPKQQFDRVIAGYNSFCLLTDDSDIRTFFIQLESFLKPGGKASLNYYHQNYWANAVAYNFIHNGIAVSYKPSFDLSLADQARGLWIDEYTTDTFSSRCEYPTRIYRDRLDLHTLFKHTSLELIEEVHEFNESNVSEPGWIDYVFQKKA